MWKGFAASYLLGNEDLVCLIQFEFFAIWQGARYFQ